MLSVRLRVLGVVFGVAAIAFGVYQVLQHG
jgi:hypothetical protein